MGENEIAQSYNGGDIIPIYTSDQLEKVGSGETVYVAETGKIYTFTDDKSYLFYGQSEDLTSILNELIDQRLSELAQSSRGNSTLLWEKEYAANSTGTDIEKITIQLDNLDDYKYLYLETYYEDEDLGWGTIGEMGNYFYPMDVIREDKTIFYGIRGFSIKYIDNKSLEISTLIGANMGYNMKLKIYGIE